jgi:hypothetical protein
VGSEFPYEFGKKADAQLIRIYFPFKISADALMPQVVKFFSEGEDKWFRLH